MENLTTDILNLSLGQTFIGKLIMKSNKIVLVNKDGLNFMPPDHPHIVKALTKAVTDDVLLIEAIANGYDVFKYTEDEKKEWERQE